MLASGYRSSRIRRIQMAHFAFHTCFGNFCGQNGRKCDRQGRQKYQKEKKQAKTVYRQNISFQKKEFCITKVFPYRTACFGRLTTLSSLAGQLVVSQTPRERRLVKWWRCCCRPFRLLVELAAKYTPPLIVSKYTPAPGLCNLNAETDPLWFQKGKFLPPFAFRLAMPRVLTPY